MNKKGQGHVSSWFMPTGGQKPKKKPMTDAEKAKLIAQLAGKQARK